MGAYFGSKATYGLCQPIISIMPPHDTYIESHLGGGAIMQRKPPAMRNIGVDIDMKTISGFKCDYQVELVRCCAHRFLRNYDYQGRELVYCDPPYLLSSRTSNRRYRFDYEEQDHIELLALLKTLPCNIILSGYPSSLYDNHLKGWQTMELQVMNQGGVRTEKLWFNFTIDRVHWVSCSGKNFTHRQCIKRKAETWGRRYKEMPRDERLAVLAAMMEAEAEEVR
jgi:site-specific DNA-adenine methylase